MQPFAAAPYVTEKMVHPLPGDAAFCVVVPGFLSPDECRDLVAQSEARGYHQADTDYPPSYRNNERQVSDNAELAERMLRRLAPVAPATLVDSANGAAWELASVNERFRFCRYLPGQQFNIHQDGVHHRGDGLQSRLTFMVYLTDGDAFDGGDTVFFSAGPGGDASGPARIIGRVRPQAGSLILFDHSLWHAGETVASGLKHIMRSDVIYRRSGGAAAPPPGALAAPRLPFQPGHHGYVWTLAALPDGGVASGGRDMAIRLWSRDGQALRQLDGHTQSVLGLAALPGNRLASVSRDRSLRLWDVAGGRCERTVAAHDAAALCVASLAGGAIATGGADSQVKLWHAGGAPLAVLNGHTGWVWEVAGTAAGALVSASEDGSIKLWDCSSGQCLHTLAGTVPLRSVAVSADGRDIIAGDIEGNITLWRSEGPCDGGDWRVMRRLRAHAAALRRVRLLAPDLLASTGEDNYMRLWRLPDWQLLGETRHDNFVTDVLALGDACLSSSYDGGLRIIEAGDSAILV